MAEIDEINVNAVNYGDENIIRYLRADQREYR